MNLFGIPLPSDYCYPPLADEVWPSLGSLTLYHALEQAVQRAFKRTQQS